MKRLRLTWLAAVLLVLPSGPASAARRSFWFPVDERLTYAVSWGPFVVGYTTVWTEWLEEDGRDLLAIRVRTRSTSVLDTLYPVDDFLESVVDPATFLPLRFMKRLSEGRYRLHEVTTFDHARRTAHWQHLLRDSQEDFAIEADTRDLLSFMFFMRSQKWEPKKKYHFRVMADEKLYDLYIASRNYEDVNLRNFGRLRSLKFEPEAAFQGLFLRSGKIVVWVSEDGRNLLTKGTAVIPFPVGTIRVALHQLEYTDAPPGDTAAASAGAAKEHQTP